MRSLPLVDEGITGDILQSEGLCVRRRDARQEINSDGNGFSQSAATGLEEMFLFWQLKSLLRTHRGLLQRLKADAGVNTGMTLGSVCVDPSLPPAGLQNSRLKAVLAFLGPFGNRECVQLITCLTIPELIEHLLKTEPRRCFLLMFAFCPAANTVSKVTSCN